MHCDNNLQQDWQNYTPSFYSKLTLIRIKWHPRLYTKLRKPPFRFTWMIKYFICSLSLSVLYWLIKFPLFCISTSIFWNKFFLSFLFCLSDIWLTSSLIATRTKIIFHSLKVNEFHVWCQVQLHPYISNLSKIQVI